MDRSTFEQTAARLRPLILRIGRDFFGSADDAEDVAQETLLQLWRYCQQLDEGRNVEALVVRVAKNCCVNMKRRQHLMLVRETDSMSETRPSPHLSPHEEVEREESLKALDEAIRQSTLRDATARRTLDRRNRPADGHRKSLCTKYGGNGKKESV